MLCRYLSAETIEKTVQGVLCGGVRRPHRCADLAHHAADHDKMPGFPALEMRQDGLRQRDITEIIQLHYLTLHPQRGLGDQRALSHAAIVAEDVDPAESRERLLRMFGQT